MTSWKGIAITGGVCLVLIIANEKGMLAPFGGKGPKAAKRDHDLDNPPA